MNAPESEQQRTTYHANCHCGLIRYTITLDDALAPTGNGVIGNCNCSICTKNGYFLVYPRREDVVFQDSCDEKLADHFFGLKRKPHRFCPQCGSSIMIDFKNSSFERQRAYLAMNSRMIKDINLDDAKFSKFDGRTQLEPVYETPGETGLSIEGQGDDLKKFYHANCHCGAVVFTVALAEPLAPEGDGKLTKCNCSICTKNGYSLVYPKRDDVRFAEGAESKLKKYWFGNKQHPHRFCGDCGSSIGIFNDTQDDEFCAMNARMFADVDLDKVEWTSFDGRNKLGPAYEM